MDMNTPLPLMLSAKQENLLRRLVDRPSFIMDCGYGETEINRVAAINTKGWRDCSTALTGGRATVRKTTDTIAPYFSITEQNFTEINWKKTYKLSVELSTSQRVKNCKHRIGQKTPH